jgi:hypothetical protein
VPIYAKFFTVTDMQTLNRFYSTEVMQNYLAKMELVQQELAPVVSKMLSEKLEAARRRLSPDGLPKQN